MVPNAVQLGNEFSKLAKRLEPSVVYITADYTPKATENPHVRGQGQEEEEGQGDSNGKDDGLDLFKRFFRNGPSAPRSRRSEPSSRNSPAPASSSIRTDTSSPTIT